MRIVGSGYNQRITLEALIVVFIISVLMCFGVETLTHLKASAKLTEPVMASMDVRAHSQIDLAFTGKGLNNYDVKSPLQSTVAPIYTGAICR